MMSSLVFATATTRWLMAFQVRSCDSCAIERPDEPG
jgi:hypothetical protein